MTTSLCPQGHPLEPGGWCYACEERAAIQEEDRRSV